MLVSARKSEIKRFAIIAFLGAVASGCAGGERWLQANTEQVRVNNAVYKVYWLQPSPGEVEVQIGPRFVVMPDPFVEERQSFEAGTTVANRLCKGKATKLS